LEWHVLGLVLLTAVGHALWNAWLKVTGDRLAALAAMGLGWTMIGVAGLPVTGPPPVSVWGFLAASVVVHTIYPLTLAAAFKSGALSVAYPISRGTGPLLVAIVSAVLLGDSIGLLGFSAVGLIVAGVIGLGWGESAHDRRTVLLSVAAGALVAAYTLIDGLGGRASPSADVYVVSMFVLSGVALIGVAFAVHGAKLPALARPLLLKGLAAGLVSGAAYWIVIWAMRSAPMGLVAAARESSVAFAALIGGYVLRERVRWGAVLLVLAGVVLVRLAG
jgi:drug/metabolite transporter (DMT)-like permease